MEYTERTDNPIQIVHGTQYGSEGKGAISAHLAIQELSLIHI